MAKATLSINDKLFIEQNYDDLSTKEIADRLGKNINDIIDYIHNSMKTHTLEELSSNLSILNKKPEWKLLRRQFTKDELELFEYSYNRLLEQFNNDVLPTEEKQIFQAIELEIFMHQNKRNRKRAVEETQRIELELQNEKNKDDLDYDRAKIENLQQQLAAYTSSLTATSREYNELSAKHGKIIETMKGTRDQRIKQLSDSKVNFLSLIKALEDEGFRKKQMTEMEIMRAAFQKEKERLTTPHVYSDNNIDTPILTIETVEQNENNN